MNASLMSYLVITLELSALSADVNLVSSSGHPSQSAGGLSVPVAISGDGRHVLFLSHANNLVTNDSLNSWMDLFSHDVATGRTRLVSVDLSGRGGGSDDSSTPSVSKDGRWVAFESAASNLGSGDSNQFSDVFLRDMTEGVTRSISSGGVVVANEASRDPQISTDGRFVAFGSKASNLMEADTNGISDIFRYDAQLQTLQRISIAANLVDLPAVADSGAHSPSMSADGQMIAFVKGTSNSVATSQSRDFNGEIFTWDALTDSVHWVSAGVTGFSTNVSGCDCFSPVMSASGEFVIFSSRHGSSASALYRQRSLPQAGFLPELITEDAVRNGSVQVSADGRFLAYDALDGVRIWDGQSSSNRLILSNLREPASRTCSAPSISADGNRVAFLVASNGVTSIYLHEYSEGTTTIAAVKPDGTPIPVAAEAVPILSEAGNVLAFDSDQSGIVDGDRNHAYDAFLVNLDTSALFLLSGHAIELPSATVAASSRVTANSISANGRVAAFMTSDLGSSDTNHFPDLYVRDLQNGDLIFLGRSNHSSRVPAFSADGRYMAYLSVDYQRDPIWAGTVGSTAAVYRVDLVTGQRRLIQMDVVWDWISDTQIAISPDGNRVAFVSQNRVIPLLGSSGPWVFAVDLRADTTHLVSVESIRSSYGQILYPAIRGNEPKFSPDGRWIFFHDNPAELYARDIDRRTTVRIGKAFSSTWPTWSAWSTYAVSGNSRYVGYVEYSVAVDPPSHHIKLFDLFDQTSATIVENTPAVGNISLSHDARWICYETITRPGQPPTAPITINVYDRLLRTNEIIYVAQGAAWKSADSHMSHDGRYVVFTSDATNLVAGDNNNARDIFIRDRWRGVTMLASVNRSGNGSGNGASLSPVLAADRRTLLFQSFASDLIDGDFNETADVFVLRLGGVDSDGDGMEDDWEVAYFGNLTRDGSGDFDEDGSNDRQEHQSGTDPTNAGSVFQVLRLTREGSRGTKLLWTATPGQAYRVEFKDDLASTQWTAVTDLVTTAGSTAVWSESDEVSVPYRFYRVMVLP